MSAVERVAGRQATIYQCLIALCGVATLLFVTARGIGLSPDSSNYIGAARSLLEGQGLSQPLTGGRYTPMVFHAPLLPALLGALGVAGLDAQDAALWLNAALFAAIIVLTGRIIVRDTGSPAAAVFGSALVMISLPVLKVHSMAWSEPLFIFLSLLALLWLNEYLRRGGDRYLLGAAAATGLAILSRYAGAFLVGAGLAVVLLRRRARARDRLRDGALFVVSSCAIGGASLLRNWLVAGTITSHPAAWHPMTFASLQNLFNTIGGWLWVDTGRRRLLLAILAVGTFVLIVRRLTGRPYEPRITSDDVGGIAVKTAVVFAVGYGLFLVFAISFFDAATALLDDRLLSPLILWTLIAAVAAADGLVSSGARWTGGIIAVALSWFAVAQLLNGLPWALQIHHHGQGYTTAVWQQSELMARVRALPPGTLIYSNGADAIYLLTGRAADRVPERMLPTTVGKNDEYEIELARMRARLVQTHGVIVYFSGIDRPNLISADELQNLVRVRVISTVADGVMFALNES